MTSRPYQLASTLAVLCLPHLLRFGTPFWAGERPSDALILCLGYIAVIWAVSLAGKDAFRRVLTGIVAFAVLGTVVVAVTTLWPDIELSRSLAIVTLGLGGILFLGGEWLPGLLRWGLLAVVVLAAGVRWWSAPATPVDAPTTHTVFSTYEMVELVSQGRVVAAEDVHLGGGFTRVGDRIVVVTGYGALYELSANGGRVAGRRLPVSRPVDIPSFEVLITTNPAEAVRVQHILSRPVAAGWELFMSHPVWDGRAHCVNLAVSAVVMSAELDRVVQDWRRIATAQPCLAADTNDHAEGFQGLLSGGRMAWLAPDRILITLGDHGWDLTTRSVAASQLDDYDYGKTRVIDLQTGRLLPFTKGHRNPQGLFIDSSGRIWSTEHGPRGGDELNLLEAGRNYGWPYATLGTSYTSLDWPPTALAPAGLSNTGPRYSWLPSIAVTALTGIEGDTFPRWRGHLMAGSLVGKALQLIGLDGDRVQFVESIPVGLRVRDLIQGPTGELWLWTDEGEITVVRQAGEATKSAIAFTACTSCHRIRPGESGGLGPNLAGVVGREVASDPAFPAYSDGLRNAGGVWTRERLDAFLVDPAAFAPGSTMYFRVPDPELRAAVVNFLVAGR